jgi:hypothetical protein
MVLEELLTIERNSGLQSLGFVAQPLQGQPLVGVAGLYQSNPELAAGALALLEQRLLDRHARWANSFKESM